MGKIIDPLKESTLFNIQAAALAITAKTSPFRSTRELNKLGTSNQRNFVAQQTLAMMNIAPVDIDRDFSLLEANAGKPSISNPNIMDMINFKNTLNTQISATDKFPSTLDPFYKLDEAVFSPLAYRTPKIAGGKIANLPDLSFILANINILNQSTNYFGKSKYF
tara:strand:- start:88 stop:579 length:492 start_codon:yes stop_codon:yes gene_type:complete